MRIRRLKSKGLVLSRLPAAQLRLLQQIPAHADPAGSPSAEERLYQSPVRTPLDDTEDELINDWNDHILPDLRSDFARQLDCVTNDLRNVRRESPSSTPSTVREDGPADDSEDEEMELPAAGETYQLVIPIDHVESWYGALNQARLVMQSRYNFPEIESLASIVALLASENLKPYLTSRFYTEIQAALLELGMGSE
ncbi:MAG: hypothetical protein ACKV19_24290 [Verrucomicrobiales bacterium]